MRAISILFILCFVSPKMIIAQKLTSDELAIKKVIEDESKYFWGRDLKNWKGLYVHKPYTTWTTATKDGVRQHKGWKDWYKEVKTYFETNPEPEPYNDIVRKYDYDFHIYGDGAWVSFIQENNGTKTLETRILEKESGKWKIAMVQLIFNLEDDTQM